MKPDLKIFGKCITLPQKSKDKLIDAYDFVFIHAFHFDSDMYIQNFEEPQFISNLNKISSVKGRIRFFLPDMPGFGESEIFNSKPKDLLPYVEVINKIVNFFHIKKLILGGCSMGGYIALEYARNNLNNLEGLILIDTKPLADNDEQKQNRLNTINTVENLLENYSQNQRSLIKMHKLYAKHSELKTYIEDLYKHVTSQKTREEKPKVANQILNLMKRQKALGIIHALNGMAGRKDTSNILKNFKKDILIIVGENDTITPIEIAKQMKSIISNAKLEILPSAGHLSNMENLLEFNQSLLKWIQIKF